MRGSVGGWRVRLIRVGSILNSGGMVLRVVRMESAEAWVKKWAIGLIVRLAVVEFALGASACWM